MNRRIVKSVAVAGQLGVICIAAIASTTCVASEVEAPFKLTTGWYHLSESGNGLDINVRHSSDYGNVWAGFFKVKDVDVQQWRAGWDRSFGDDIRLQPSIQVASGGFAGGSLNVETGTNWVAGAGLGRTNLRPYYNLNFDPNDSWYVLAGYRGDDGKSVVATYVRDNRENPDQQHFHLTIRTPMLEKQRLTLDVLYKRGLVENQRIGKLGATLTYDWPKFFARIAYDPRTNFTPDNAWRLSIGTRF